MRPKDIFGLMKAKRIRSMFSGNTRGCSSDQREITPDENWNHYKKRRAQEMTNMYINIKDDFSFFLQSN